MASPELLGEPVGNTAAPVEDQEKKREPKGLNTVFIHKLYHMLEDTELAHLMWWGPSGDSFVITPGEEFSRALALYFKHTNVASFVRQLNMYGFHKVSDGGDGGETLSWEFRHSAGAFRKGDVEGLKAIKRRSSKAHRNAATAATADTVSSDGEGGQHTYVTHEQHTSQAQDQVDSLLGVRLAELGHSLAALRHEHARLQLRYDTAAEELRRTNLDMVQLLELLQRVGSVSSSAHAAEEAEADIARLRGSLLQRTAREHYEYAQPMVRPYGYPQPPHHPGSQPSDGLHDPFQQKPRSRNVSVLCDPLQSTPTMASPASMPRSSVSEAISPNIQHGSYFPDARAYGARTHSPDPHWFPREREPTPGSFPREREQTPGSFPGVAPMVHNSLRGDASRKRHLSNDAIDFQNPPRSVPLEPQLLARKSLSATNIATQKQQTNVYALLNPERGGTGNQSPAKKARS